MIQTPMCCRFENPAGRVVEHHWLDSGFLEVEYYPGPRQLADLRLLLVHTKQLLLLHGWNKLLSDQRVMAPYSAEEQYWVSAVWLSTLSPQSGRFFGALVLGADEFAKVSSVLQSQEEQLSPMKYRVFEAPTPARWWLREQQILPLGLHQPCILMER